MSKIKMYSPEIVRTETSIPLDWIERYIQHYFDLGGEYSEDIDIFLHCTNRINIIGEMVDAWELGVDYNGETEVENGK